MKHRATAFKKDLQYYKFCAYGFLKNLRLFEPFIMLFFLENGLTFLQIGGLYSIREITRNVFEIPAGIIADSLGRRRTMIWSFTFYIMSFLIFYFAKSYTVFIAAMVFFSLGDAFRTGTHKAMIFDYLRIHGWENQKVTYYGLTHSWSQMGSALSALISATFVFITGSFRWIFLVSVVPYLLDLILMSTYPKILDGATSALSRKQIARTFKKVFLDFLKSFTNSRLLKAIGNMSVYTGYYKAAKDYLQPVLQTFALSVPVFLVMKNRERESIIIGVIYFIIYLITSFTSRRAGRFSDLFGKLNLPLNITLLVGLSAGALSGLFYHFELFALSIILYIFIYVVENLRKPIAVSYISEAGNKNILASVLSAESQAEAIFAAILAPLIGYVADQISLGYSIFAVSAFLVILSPLFLLRKKVWNQTSKT
ncbi:MAG: MFS transporter [Bacteroidales bacterium]|nr:MFS transporter [Bacteroidales bacterium]